MPSPTLTDPITNNKNALVRIYEYPIIIDTVPSTHYRILLDLYGQHEIQIITFKRIREMSMP